MYGGYSGGWLPEEYLTSDLPLTVYESKAGNPT